MITWHLNYERVVLIDGALISHIWVWHHLWLSYLNPPLTCTPCGSFFTWLLSRRLCYGHVPLLTIYVCITFHYASCDYCPDQRLLPTSTCLDALRHFHLFSKQPAAGYVIHHVTMPYHSHVLSPPGFTCMSVFQSIGSFGLPLFVWLSDGTLLLSAHRVIEHDWPRSHRRNSLNCLDVID